MRSLLLAGVLVLAGMGSAAGMHAQQAGSHAVTFENKTGNEWWVEVIVTGSPTRVDARDDGGAWVALELKSWGAWAKSFHIEPGHRVQFRASWSDGASVESCWFTHPAGEEQCTTPPPPPPPGNFTFSHGGGNEWWVEAKVSPRPESVQAMDTGGAWVALELKSWGEWAASFRVEPGHQVKFRALSGGVWHESCWFTHPAGVAQCDPTPPPPGTFAFKHAGGNEWWIEAKVDPRPATVEAMDTNGAWTRLEFKSWGEWAASFRIEPGHEVRFRAKTSSGAWEESCWFSHPAGVERCEGSGAPWPREGSYVQYRLREGLGVPGHSEETLLWLNYTYQGGAWRGTCEGWHHEDNEYEGASRERVNTTAATAPPPLNNPKAPQLGQQVVSEVPRCEPENVTAYVQERAVATNYHWQGSKPSFLQNGQPVSIPVWRSTYEDDSCPCEYGSVQWHPDTGLAISYTVGYRYSSHRASLLDTDAPISEAQTQKPPVPAWPKEGSFAEYRVNLSHDDGTVYAVKDLRFTHRNGAWTTFCDGESLSSSPPMGPKTTQAGALVRPTEVPRCDITPPVVVVQGQYPYWTTKNGQPHRANVWWGDEHPDTYGDEDGRWDVATGLLLEWEDQGGYFRGDTGYLRDTDAPLSSR